VAVQEVRRRVQQALVREGLAQQAGFTNSATLNGDKLSTLQYLFTLSQQHGMLWAGSGMHPSNAKASTRDDLNNLGGYSGLITATPSDASVDEMVAGDLATARAFGQRIVEALSLVK
jgi:NAD(P)H dehydrogenase (quinone)